LLKDIVGKIDQLPKVERNGSGKTAGDIAVFADKITFAIDRACKGIDVYKRQGHYT